MEFETKDQLVEFFNTLDLTKTKFVFKEECSDSMEDEPSVEDEKEKDCACKGHGPCQCGTKVQTTEATVEVPSEIIVESFSDSPTFKTKVIESGDNVFHVKDFMAIENACGTGKVILSDRVSHMNMCEMNNKAVVNLTVVVEDKKFTLPFTLAKTEQEPYLEINKTHLA